MESLEGLTPEQKKVALNAVRKFQGEDVDKSVVSPDNVETSARKRYIVGQDVSRIGLSYHAIKSDLRNRIQLKREVTE